MKALITTTLVAILTLAPVAGYAANANANDYARTNQANINHPNINDNNGPGQNANPNGANDGGANMHGIGNNPGKSGDKPNDDGTNGFANELNTVHGGISDVNKNVD